VNLLTRRRGVEASAQRLRSAFCDRVRVLPPPEAGNTVALAAAGAPIRESFADLRDGARKLKAQTGLDLHPTLARLQQACGGDEFLL